MRKLLKGLMVCAVVASGCGNPADVPDADGVTFTSSAQAHPSASSTPVLRSLMICTGDVGGTRQRYEVYEWSDGSLQASCEVSDAQHRAVGNQLYRAEQAGVASAWAVCATELATAIPGARSTSWQFVSHRGLNTAVVTYGGVEPPFVLQCSQVPVMEACGSPS